MGKKREIVERFWDKVTKNGCVPRHAPELGPCWIWIGCRAKNGYGKFRIGGQVHLAHRVASAISGVLLPDGLHVLHHCDNPPCVNPAHLRLGTPKDNAEDATQRGRRRGRPKRPPFEWYKSPF